MNNTGFLASPKWDIIKEIATTSQSPTSLAKKLQTSIPNMLHHLKLLEAYGIVASSTAYSKKTGKPPTIYGLAKPFALLLLVDELGSLKKVITPGNREKFIIRTIIDHKEEWANALIKITIEHPELLKDNTSMALLNKKETEADLLLITPEIHIYRKEKNRLSTRVKEKEYVLKVWSHTIEEYKEGLKNNEEYFKKYINSEIIHDPKAQLKRANNESIA